MSAMRRSTIGKSPETPCDHKPDCAPLPEGLSPRWTHGRRGINHVSCESLKQARLARGYAKMMQLHLTLRPRQRRSARESGRIAMLVDAVEKRFAAGGGDRPVGDTNGRARRDANAPADGENWVEDSADRV